MIGTREFNFLELDGDYDLFGDGSVMILSTPGHTIGHQSMKVKTASGGTIIITQDAVWMQENLDGYPAGLNYSVTGLHQLREPPEVHARPRRRRAVHGARRRSVQGQGRSLVQVSITGRLTGSLERPPSRGPFCSDGNS